MKYYLRTKCIDSYLDIVTIGKNTTNIICFPHDLCWSTSGYPLSKDNIYKMYMGITRKEYEFIYNNPSLLL